MSLGYVYIMSNHSMPGLLKIGRTASDPDRRARELHTTGVPTPFKIEYFGLWDDHEGVELGAHAHLDGCRQHGAREFFKIDVPTAILAIRAAADSPAKHEDVRYKSPEEVAAAERREQQRKEQEARAIREQERLAKQEEARREKRLAAKRKADLIVEEKTAAYIAHREEYSQKTIRLWLLIGLSASAVIGGVAKGMPGLLLLPLLFIMAALFLISPLIILHGIWSRFSYKRDARQLYDDALSQTLANSIYYNKPYDDILQAVEQNWRSAKSLPTEGPKQELQQRGADISHSLSVDAREAAIGAKKRIIMPNGKALDVKIPPAVCDGTTLRLRGQGAPGRNGGPAGDALMLVSITGWPQEQGCTRESNTSAELQKNNAVVQSKTRKAHMHCHICSHEHHVTLMAHELGAKCPGCSAWNFDEERWQRILDGTETSLNNREIRLRNIAFDIQRRTGRRLSLHEVQDRANDFTV